MQARALAPSNIAFLKYWGRLDAELNLPLNGSLSMCLDAASTTTEVRFDPERARDEVFVDGTPLDERGRRRVAAILDLVRARAGLEAGARVDSRNTFPMGTGIASSASGFAALALAASHAAGLSLDEAALSALARRGSGSAARSIPDGFVAWRAGTEDDESVARSLAPPEHWDLHDVVAVVSREHKAVGSLGGHELAATSPHMPARLRGLRARLPAMRDALMERDLATLGPLLETEALELHAIALTSAEPLLYWTPGTLAVIGALRRWRAEGLAAYFTLDAGPNVHVICEGGTAEELVRALEDLPAVASVLHNRPAVGARLL